MRFFEGFREFRELRDEPGDSEFTRQVKWETRWAMGFGLVCFLISLGLLADVAIRSWFQ